MQSNASETCQSFMTKSSVFYVPQRPRLKPMNQPLVVNKQKLEKVQVKIFPSLKKDLKLGLAKKSANRKLVSSSVETNNNRKTQPSPSKKSLADRLRDIEPTKPRTYFKAAGDVI